METIWQAGNAASETMISACR